MRMRAELPLLQVLIPSRVRLERRKAGGRVLASREGGQHR